MGIGTLSQPAGIKNPPVQNDSHTHTVDDMKKSQNAHKFEIGSMVQYGDPPQYGTIQWIGVLPDCARVLYAGLDMVSN